MSPTPEKHDSGGLLDGRSPAGGVLLEVSGFVEDEAGFGLSDGDVRGLETYIELDKLTSD